MDRNCNWSNFCEQGELKILLHRNEGRMYLIMLATFNGDKRKAVLGRDGKYGMEISKGLTQ